MNTDTLLSPAPYQRAIQKLYNKAAANQTLNFKNQLGVNLMTMNLYSDSLSELLAKSIREQSYQAGRVVPRAIVTGSKTRIVYQLDVIDHIVQTTIYDFLMQAQHHRTHQQVYSYLPGRSGMRCAQALAAHFREANYHPKRDLYVLRSDVVSYTDTILLTPSALAWEKLNALLDCLTFPTLSRDYLFELLQGFIRPEVMGADGDYQAIIGVPMGTPMSTLLAVLYLEDVDNQLAAIPGSFYGRYGDDMVFAHHEIEAFVEAEKRLDASLQQLQLTRHPHKDQRIFLTRGACPKAGWDAGDCIEFVGYSVSRRGTISLSKRRSHSLLNSIRQRIDNAATLCAPQTKQAALCEVVRNMLDAKHPARHDILLQTLQFTTDRTWLSYIDKQIALRIAETISGQRGIRAFRAVSYRTLRESGLPSLVVYKNKQGKAGLADCS